MNNLAGTQTAVEMQTAIGSRIVLIAFFYTGLRVPGTFGREVPKEFMPTYPSATYLILIFLATLNMTKIDHVF